MRLAIVAALAPVALLSAGCCGTCAPPPDTSASGGTASDAHRTHPDVVEVEVAENDGRYDFTVTISSPYDTPERYADGWRVKGPNGTVFGEHELMHDHQDEQPFTRTQTGVEIPDDVREVTVEARDSENGYGGGTRTVDLP